jgi:hypothetical protein
MMLLSLPLTIFKNYNGNTVAPTKNFGDYDEFSRLYLKGIMEMSPVKNVSDANFTMRVSLGMLRATTRDAVKYDYVCTMKGVLEKYQPEIMS